MEGLAYMTIIPTGISAGIEHVNMILHNAIETDIDPPQKGTRAQAKPGAIQNISMYMNAS